MYETIRTLTQTNNLSSNEKLLFEVVSKEDLETLLIGCIDSDVILLEKPKINGDNQVCRGVFRKGNLEEVGINFHLCGKSQEVGYDLNLKFKDKFHHKVLSGVYDIMCVDTIKENLAVDHSALKVFHFEAHAGSESEFSDVIHVDPFLAYNHLINSNKTKSNEQWLRCVEPIIPGKVFYQYEPMRE